MDERGSETRAEAWRPPLRAMSVAEALDVAFYTMLRRWRDFAPVWLIWLVALEAQRLDGLLQPSSEPALALAWLRTAAWAGLEVYFFAVTMALATDLFLAGAPTLRRSLAVAWSRWMAVLAVTGVTSASLLVGAVGAFGVLSLIASVAGWPGWPSIAASLTLSTTAVVLGTLGCIASFVFVGWGLAAPIAVVERCGPAASLRRSWRLTRGSRRRLGPVLLAAAALPLALTLLLAWAIPGEGLPERAVLDLVSVAASTFVSLVSLALYFDVRCRAEALDLQMLAARVEVVENVIRAEVPRSTR